MKLCLTGVCLPSSHCWAIYIPSPRCFRRANSWACQTCRFGQVTSPLSAPLVCRLSSLSSLCFSFSSRKQLSLPADSSLNVVVQLLEVEKKKNLDKQEITSSSIQMLRSAPIIPQRRVRAFCPSEHGPLLNRCFFFSPFRDRSWRCWLLAPFAEPRNEQISLHSDGWSVSALLLSLFFLLPAWRSLISPPFTHKHLSSLKVGHQADGIELISRGLLPPDEFRLRWH